VELGERAWLMREALERARHDLTYSASLRHSDPADPVASIDADVADTLAWIDKALVIDPKLLPPT
jgi:hypothetical protein